MFLKKKKNEEEKQWTFTNLVSCAYTISFGNNMQAEQKKTLNEYKLRAIQYAPLPGISYKYSICTSTRAERMRFAKDFTIIFFYSLVASFVSIQGNKPISVRSLLSSSFMSTVPILVWKTAVKAIRAWTILFIQIIIAIMRNHHNVCRSWIYIIKICCWPCIVLVL